MKKEKMNNKGFSLVELIIVVAIMAILIAVLAPQYLKFVERSRKSADMQNVDEIVRALEIYSADPTVTDSIPNNATITITTTSQAVDASGVCSSTIVSDALKAAGIEKVILKSSKWTYDSGTSLVLTITVDADGNLSVDSNVKDDEILGNGTSSTSTPVPTT